MRKRGQGKSGIGETHPIGFFAKNLVSGFDERSLVFGHRLSAGFFDPFLDDQSMHFSPWQRSWPISRSERNLESGRASY